MKLLIAALMLTCLATFAFSQEKLRHPNPVLSFKQIRITSPARISYIDGKSIEIIEEWGKEINYLKLEIDTDTQLVPKMKANNGKLYWFIYCVEHQVLRFVENYEPVIKK